MNNITFDIIKYAEATPEAPALLLERGSLNYRALNHAVWRFAQYLHQHGVRAGDIIALTIRDELRLVLTILGLVRLGATAFSIPRSATAHQREQMCARVGMKLLVVDEQSRHMTKVPLLMLDRDFGTTHEMHIDSSLLAADPEVPWLLIYGSGSTGAPKLIPVTHSQTMHRSQMATSALGITAADRLTSLSHFDFSTSKFRLHEALSVGASFALNVWTSPDVIARIRQQAISVVYATVFHAEVLLLKMAEARAPALNAVRVMELTASTISDHLRQRIRNLMCPNLHVRYAMNEAGPVCCAYPHDVLRVSGTVGMPLAGVQIRIVDKAGLVVEDGVIGLVHIRSPGLVNHYWDDVEATQKCFIDGWFATGDLAKRTPEGELVYFGRADFMMIMNGINIYPEEIEQLMVSHPKVQDAAVLAMLHRVHQDVPMCAVTLRLGEVITESELLAFATEKLGAHGPRRVLIFDQIPRNGEAKLKRAELAQMMKSRLLEIQDNAK